MLDLTTPNPTNKLTLTPTSVDPATKPPSLDPLDAIADAYAAGDAPLAEHLFNQALDADLPWTDVCAAAARGIALRYGEPVRA